MTGSTAWELVSPAHPLRGLEAIDVFDAFGEPCALIDASDRIAYANRACVDLFGGPRETLLGRALDAVLPELLREPARGAFFAARTPGRTSRFELARDDGRTFLEIVAFPCGPCTAVVVRDVTQRKQTEQALLRSRHELADFFENATVGLHWLGPDGRILWVNDAELAMLGYAREDVVGRHVGDFHVDRRAIDAVLSRLFAGETLRDVEVRLACKDGSVRDALLDVSARWEDGRFVHGRCFTRDVTEAKRASERLLEANRHLQRSNEDLEQFAYAASHDLREPLRMIAIYAQLLQRRYAGKLGADADDYIRFVVDGAMRMEQLLEDLLAYSQAGEGAHAEHERCSSADALSSALENLAASLESSGGAIEVGDLPEVRAAQIHVASVLQNLIGNSLKYRSSDPPRVRVGAVRQDDAWVFSVADNGIGIEPRYHDQVFKIFKRLHGAKYPGTGVGLAICAKIVERYGGRIWVESDLGRGATFRFTLPA